ncbi:MAG: hypothetical protein LBQ12_15705 [Deltaproteobacteria bacterium]|jgi:hypothetical protein|nr:hypothetical protein [Deltaproteobacteria bacterium]
MLHWSAKSWAKGGGDCEGNLGATLAAWLDCHAERGAEAFARVPKEAKDKEMRSMNKMNAAMRTSKED